MNHMWISLMKHFEQKGVYFNDAETQLIQAAFKSGKYRKNQYILQQGDVARYESFIVDGLVRMYLVDKSGKDHVVYFATEDHWIGDLRSHYYEIPSEYNIDCLEPTHVLQINKTELAELCKKIPQMNHFLILLYRNSIMWHESRMVSALSKTSLQRYHEFSQKYSYLEQRIPLVHIASYLGVTPQSLSRIRRQNAGK